ncbi:hypothetical protein OQA88_11446 [Cercophora sp. LCS_1]
MGFGTGIFWLSVALSLFETPCDAGRVRPRDDIPNGFVAPPYYPAPHGGWVTSWRDSYAKAQKLVSQMTLAEKTNITGGVGIYMGSTLYSALGVASADNITAFPAGITTGATWDKKLIYARGVALGKEFRGKGANVYLGPTVGPLGRKPLGGRNWEGFGADPVLQAVAAALTIKGVQEQGVIATIKHLVGNEQEMYRMYNPFQPGYSANIDDRTLHELYLWPFAEAVKAGVGAVMTAYNAVNGSACSQNSYLMNGILKDELGFQGFVMSDWLAHISGVPAALAGLDMSMPGDTMVPLFGYSYWKYELTRSVLNGSVPLERLNDMATRIVAAWYQFGQDKDYPRPNFSANSDSEYGLLHPGAVISPWGKINWFVNVQADHYKVARQVAQDAITMLKNDGNALPLKASSKISVFGTDAAVNPDGPNACMNRACNKGTLGMGWGSGVANYPYFDDPISAIRRRVPSVAFYNTDSFPRINNPADDEAAIVFLSSDAGENTFTVEGNHGDRDNSKLSAWYGGDELVKNAAAKFKTVIVVVHTVGPLVLEPWIDLPSVKAVLFAHLPGQEAGESLTNILFGDVSPSGHLPYSIVKASTDLPDSVSNLRGFAFGQVQDTYSEGLYIDYRHLNKNKIKPRYAFGHGLSYTSFNITSANIKRVVELSPISPPRQPKLGTPVYSTTIPPAAEGTWPNPLNFTQVWRFIYSWIPEKEANEAYAIGSTGKTKYVYPAGYSETQTAGPESGGGEGGNPALWDVAYEVEVTVKNVGDKFAGKASVQAYVQFPEGIQWDTPVVQLRDFEKTDVLAPGQEQTVKLRLTRKDLSVWDVRAQNWVVPKVDGKYGIWIGEASDKLGLACWTDDLVCQGGQKFVV